MWVFPARTPRVAPPPHCSWRLCRASDPGAGRSSPRCLARRACRAGGSRTSRKGENEGSRPLMPNPKVTSTLSADAQKVTCEALQDAVVDLIDLSLLAKQAHWNLLGRNFRN